MKCPFCAHQEDKVIDSRESKENNVIRRRRECLKCAKRFTTYEKIELIPIMVVKKDNRREEFDREKLLNGIVTACEKRPISMDILEQIVNDIERKLWNGMNKEVASEEIGELVMKKLHDLDAVAYVRFASVYRQFEDIGDFLDHAKTIIKNRGC
ncbi:MAG: transcriptional regulator NrdR [bacterium]|nr:transcriptional regulator NrdR [bacterium]